jgi:hypothetical protein
LSQLQLPKINLNVYISNDLSQVRSKQRHAATAAHSRQRQRNGRAIFRIEAEHDLIISALTESRILSDTDGKAV